MHRVGGACARSSSPSSFGELSGRESLARTELRRLHALVARFAEARSPQVEACAGRRLLNTSKFQIIPCKVAGNFRYNTVTEFLSHIFCLSTARCGIQVGCNSVAASGVAQSLGGGGSKSRRARDATVRSGAFVAGADCAARGVGRGGACSGRRRLKALTPSVGVFSPSAAGAGDSCA